MEKKLTVVIPIIRDDLVERCLETLYAYTPPGTFYVYIVDQTIRGIDDTKLRNQYRNLMVIRPPKSDVHYTGNLGFAQANNLAFKLVQTPYFMMLNDDCEMVHPAWLDGVWDTFKMIEKATPESPAIMVNVASIRLADWSVGLPAGQDFDILPYKENYTNEDWDFLVNKPHYINEHLTIQPSSVFDGVTLYASVIDSEKYREVGMLDERYKFGGGEDYDYSCLARMMGYRSVNTTLSWCFHHWSSSFKSVRDKEDIKGLIIPELSWNHNHAKWGSSFDIWGMKCEKCGERLTGIESFGTIFTCPKHPEIQFELPGQYVSPL